jgi:hypothetical protein
MPTRKEKLRKILSEQHGEAMWDYVCPEEAMKIIEDSMEEQHPVCPRTRPKKHRLSLDNLIGGVVIGALLGWCAATLWFYFTSG